MSALEIAWRELRAQIELDPHFQEKKRMLVYRFTNLEGDTPFKAHGPGLHSAHELHASPGHRPV